MLGCQLFPDSKGESFLVPLSALGELGRAWFKMWPCEGPDLLFQGELSLQELMQAVLRFWLQGRGPQAAGEDTDGVRVIWVRAGGQQHSLLCTTSIRKSREITLICNTGFTTIPPG